MKGALRFMPYVQHLKIKNDKKLRKPNLSRGEPGSNLAGSPAAEPHSRGSRAQTWRVPQLLGIRDHEVQTVWMGYEPTPLQQYSTLDGGILIRNSMPRYLRRRYSMLSPTQLAQFCEQLLNV